MRSACMVFCSTKTQNSNEEVIQKWFFSHYTVRNKLLSDNNHWSSEPRSKNTSQHSVQMRKLRHSI